MRGCLVGSRARHKRCAVVGWDVHALTGAERSHTARIRAVRHESSPARPSSVSGATHLPPMPPRLSFMHSSWRCESRRSLRQHSATSCWPSKHDTPVPWTYIMVSAERNKTETNSFETVLKLFCFSQNKTLRPWNVLANHSRYLFARGRWKCGTAKYRSDRLIVIVDP